MIKLLNYLLSLLKPRELKFYKFNQLSPVEIRALKPRQSNAMLKTSKVSR